MPGDNRPSARGGTTSVAQETMLQRALAILSVAAEISSDRDPVALPMHAARCLHRQLGLQAVSILLPDPATGNLNYRAEIGVPPGVKQLGFRQSGTTRTVFKTGIPQFVENVLQDPATNPGIRTYFRSFACLPLDCDGNRLGLVFVNYREPHAFDALERQILKTYAGQIAIALERASTPCGPGGKDVRPNQVRLVADLLGGLAGDAQAKPAHSVFACGPFQFDFAARTAYRDGRPLDFKTREMSILEILVTDPGRTHSRSELLRLAWEADARPGPRTVDVHVASLRKKLGDYGKRKLIATVGGQGYRWTEWQAGWPGTPPWAD